MGITFTLPNIGLVQKLRKINEATNNTAVAWWQLNLGPVTVSDTTDHTSLGSEASFPGYARQASASGTVTGSNSTTVASLSLAPVTFTCTAAPVSPQTIWSVSYFLNESTADPLVVANLPNGPQVISQPGDSIVAQLQLTDQRAPGQP